MKVTFLGTGTSQGVPVIGCQCEVCLSLDYRDKRLRSSILIQDEEDFQVVIDTGPDFRQQMLRERVRKLEGVFFTHAHKDHTAGLDDIRSFNFLQKKDMPVFGEKPVLDQLRREFAYIFSETKYPGIPQVALNEITEQSFSFQGKEIIPIRVMHHKLPVLGFRIGNFTYITDANHIPEEEKEKIKGSSILVLNALQKDPHISHFTLDEAVKMAEEIGATNTYLTHISHKLGLHKGVSNELPENVQLAYDGLTLTI